MAVWCSSYWMGLNNDTNPSHTASATLRQAQGRGPCQNHASTQALLPSPSPARHPQRRLKDRQERSRVPLQQSFLCEKGFSSTFTPLKPLPSLSTVTDVNNQPRPSFSVHRQQIEPAPTPLAYELPWLDHAQRSPFPTVAISGNLPAPFLLSSEMSALSFNHELQQKLHECQPKFNYYLVSFCAFSFWALGYEER